MTAGIYGYLDTKINRFVYEGKDSYIDKDTAHKRHLAPRNYHDQVINKILQNNPDRYKYIVLQDNITSEKLLNDTEKFYINFFGTFRPETNFGFNFTKGGDGMLGYRLPFVKARNTTGIAYVSCRKKSCYQQGFCYRYRWREGEKVKEMLATSMEDLKQKVEAKSLPWVKVSDLTENFIYNN